MTLHVAHAARPRALVQRVRASAPFQLLLLEEAAAAADALALAQHGTYAAGPPPSPSLGAAETAPQPTVPFDEESAAEDGLTLESNDDCQLVDSGRIVATPPWLPGA